MTVDRVVTLLTGRHAVSVKSPLLVSLRSPKIRGHVYPLSAWPGRATRESSATSSSR